MNKPSFYQIWVMAIRPKTLWVTICPVLIGALYSFHHHGLNWGLLVVTLLTAVLIQIGTNFANDYYDAEKGADTEDRLGPIRVTSMSWVKPETMKAAFEYAFILAFFLGLYLVVKTNIFVLILGLICILFGFLYSATRFSLAYLGLADFAAFLFFGPVAVAGTYFIQSLEFSWGAVLWGISPGMFSLALLSVNNIRDVVQDKRANKNTLAVRYGVVLVQGNYLSAMLLACLSPLVMAMSLSEPFWAILPALSLLYTVEPIRLIQQETGRRLNEGLGLTVQVEVLVTGLMFLAWFLGK